MMLIIVNVVFIVANHVNGMVCLLLLVNYHMAGVVFTYGERLQHHTASSSYDFGYQLAVEVKLCRAIPVKSRAIQIESSVRVAYPIALNRDFG